MVNFNAFRCGPREFVLTEFDNTTTFNEGKMYFFQTENYDHVWNGSELQIFRILLFNNNNSLSSLHQ